MIVMNREAQSKTYTEKPSFRSARFVNWPTEFHVWTNVILSYYHEPVKLVSLINICLTFLHVMSDGPGPFHTKSIDGRVKCIMPLLTPFHHALQRNTFKPPRDFRRYWGDKYSNCFESIICHFYMKRAVALSLRLKPPNSNTDRGNRLDRGTKDSETTWRRRETCRILCLGCSSNLVWNLPMASIWPLLSQDS